MSSPFREFRVVPYFVFVALVLGLSISAPAASWARSPETLELSEFEGDWKQIDPEVAQASRMSAIDEAVDGLSWVVRQMAAPVLRRSTAPPPRMQFVWREDHLEQSVFVSGGEKRTRPVDFRKRAAGDVDSRGEPMAAQWQRTPGGLRLDWTQDQAYGSNLYRVDSDSETLIVEHTIQVTAISDVEPITFQSRFARRALPAVAAEADADPTGSRD